MRLPAFALLATACSPAIHESAPPPPLEPPPIETTEINGALGGTACSADGIFCVEVPPTTFDDDLTLRIQRELSFPAPDEVVDQLAYRVTRPALSGNSNGRVRVSFDVASSTLAGRADFVTVAVADFGAWTFDPLIDREVDEVESIVSARSNVLGVFGLVDQSVGLCSQNPCGGVANLRVHPVSPGGAVLAPCPEAGPCAADMGAVPVFGQGSVEFVLFNPSDETVTVAPAITMASSTALWGHTLTSSGLSPRSSARLVVRYRPDVEGPATATVNLTTNASGPLGSYDLTVSARGALDVAPDIAVQIDATLQPAPSQCADLDLDGVTDYCTTDAVTFGAVASAGQHTERITIQNLADCSASSCDACRLEITGLGFVTGTNDDGHFSFVGSTTGTIRIPGVGCGMNELRMLVTFDAPTQSGSYGASVLVESNDPDESLIEVPLAAQVHDGSEAVASIRACPDTPCTDPSQIGPADTVHLDGSASHRGGDSQMIVQYQWEVTDAPAGVDTSTLNTTGDGTPYFSFDTSVAGQYTVCLTVTDVDGLQSTPTQTSCVTVQALPTAGLLTQLVWDSSTVDLDLHFVFVTHDDRVCNATWDCHWNNRQPIWFPADPAGTGQNPSMTLEDDGVGPEVVEVETPGPGAYRIFVHYYDDADPGPPGPTVATLRTFVGGVLTSQLSRTLDADDVWAAADVTVDAVGQPHITRYPSDGNGDGEIASMMACVPPGWAFP